MLVYQRVNHFQTGMNHQVWWFTERTCVRILTEKSRYLDSSNAYDVAPGKG